MKPDENTLRSLYLEERRTLREIAEPLGVSAALVRKWLLAAGIPTRNTSEANRVAKKRTYSPEQIERMRVSAAHARSKIKPEHWKKQADSQRGRVAPNKGKPWTPEERSKHMATRATDKYKENLSASLRGEKSYAWKGGITPESARQLQGWQWRRKRVEVYERDSYQCQDCGCKCLNTKDSKRYPKRKIQCHHIVPRRQGGGDELLNLVTLCMSCHHKRERKGS